jgi:hypothetical protein
MTSEEFRSRLARLGLTVPQLADRLAHLGDNRPRATIVRTLYDLASPNRHTPAPWAVAVILALMEERQTG